MPIGIDIENVKKDCLYVIHGIEQPNLQRQILGLSPEGLSHNATEWLKEAQYICRKTEKIGIDEAYKLFDILNGISWTII